MRVSRRQPIWYCAEGIGLMAIHDAPSGRSHLPNDLEALSARNRFTMTPVTPSSRLKTNP